MNGTIRRILHSLANRWVMLALACVIGVQLGSAPALAQNGDMTAAQKKKLQEQLKKTFAEGANAGKQKNYDTAISKFKEALKMAEKLSATSATNQIQNYLVKSLKSAASVDMNQENWSAALAHYEEVMEYDNQDPVVYLNKGMAHMSMDSTEAGLTALQKAIQLGNKVGNTRVSGTATERIQDEFLARASRALQGQNPSEEQINTALDALDEMTKYVPPSADSKFYRATALFELGELQEAIETAREGLDMHQGSRSDAAKFYFIIAESQFDLGNTAQACQTFENAAYGDYQARSEHYLKNECES